MSNNQAFEQAIAFATPNTPSHTASPSPSSTPQADIQYTSLTIVGSGAPSVITALVPEVEVTPI